MNETELLESSISEYSNLFQQAEVKTNRIMDTDRLVSKISKEHDWTQQGAHTIVCLANEYGAFMLRNALALAIVLGKEDGNLGF